MGQGILGKNKERGDKNMHKSGLSAKTCTRKETAEKTCQQKRKKRKVLEIKEGEVSKSTKECQWENKAQEGAVSNKGKAGELTSQES